MQGSLALRPEISSLAVTTVDPQAPTVKLDCYPVPANLSGLLEALQDASILQDWQVDEAAREMLPDCANAAHLLEQLVSRGWLTPFQADRIRQGAVSTLVLFPYLLLDLLGEEPPAASKT